MNLRKKTIEKVDRFYLLTRMIIVTIICVQSLAANDQITVHHESGGSGDCIQETGW